MTTEQMNRINEINEALINATADEKKLLNKELKELKASIESEASEASDIANPVGKDTYNALLFKDGKPVNGYFVERVEADSVKVRIPYLVKMASSISSPKPQTLGIWIPREPLHKVGSLVLKSEPIEINAVAIAKFDVNKGGVYFTVSDVRASLDTTKLSDCVSKVKIFTDSIKVTASLPLNIVDKIKDEHAKNLMVYGFGMTDIINLKKLANEIADAY